MILKFFVNFKVVDSHITSLEDYGWETTEANADEENENQKFSMFGANESPGLYGEIADYWKSYEDNDITDRNETFNNTYNNSTVIFGTQCANLFCKFIV